MSLKTESDGLDLLEQPGAIGIEILDGKIVMGLKFSLHGFTALPPGDRVQRLQILSDESDSIAVVVDFVVPNALSKSADG